MLMGAGVSWTMETGGKETTGSSGGIICEAPWGGEEAPSNGVAKPGWRVLPERAKERGVGRAAKVGKPGAEDGGVGL